MKTVKASWLLCLTLALGACGGGGGGSSSDGGSNGGNTSDQVIFTAKPHVTGSVLTYLSTTTDNRGGTSSVTEISQIGSKDNNGSYTQTIEAYSTPTSGGTPVLTDRTINYWNSAREVYKFDDVAAGVSSTCTVSPRLKDYPATMSLSSTWGPTTVTLTCQDNITNKTTFSEGRVIGLETITVPAGVYQTVHIREKSTLELGVAGRSTVTVQDQWIDTVTGDAVQVTESYSYVGTPPLGTYDVSFTSKLQKKVVGN